MPNSDYTVLLTLNQFVDNNWQPIRISGPIYWRVTLKKEQEAYVSEKLMRDTPVVFTLEEADTISFFISIRDEGSMVFYAGFLFAMPELDSLEPKPFVSLVS